MKKIAVWLVSVLLLCLTACADSGQPDESLLPESTAAGSTAASTGQTEAASSAAETTLTTVRTAASSAASQRSTSAKPASTTAKTTLADQPYIPPTAGSTLAPNQRQLIPDNDFYYGMTVRSQKDHQNGDTFSDLGQFRYLTKNGSPSWIVAQWDSGPCLWKDRVSSAANTLTDGKSKWITYLQDGGLSLRLNSAPYYTAKPDHAAAAGDYWPHLLLEAPDFGYSSLGKRERAYYRCDMEKLTLSMDIRLAAYAYTENPRDYAHLSQYLLYLYVSGVDSPDRIWFGVTLFSSAQEKTGLYVARDSGKADASGDLIYLLGTEDTYARADGSLWKNGRPAPGNRWVHVELDLTAPLHDMFAEARLRGCLSDKVTSPADLAISGMNVGFETVGTYDVTVDIRHMNLISTR